MQKDANPPENNPAPQKKMKIFRRSEMPGEIGQQMTKQWIVSEMEHKGLLDREKLSRRDQHKRTDQMMQVTFLAVVIGGCWYFMMEGIAIMLLLCLPVVCLVFFLSRNAHSFDEGRLLYLYNMGAHATGTLLRVEPRYGHKTHMLEFVRCVYSFENSKSETFYGDESLHTQFSQWDGVNELKKGDTVQILYHPQYPLLSTVYMNGRERSFSISNVSPVS